MRHGRPLETITLDVPQDAVPPYEAALRQACRSVGFFHDPASTIWRLEAVHETGDDAALTAGLALAALVSGHEAVLQRAPIAASGWLARTRSAFPEQRVGRFTLRGTHLPPAANPGRVTIMLDAGVAFGSGEHGSTRGCLRALEAMAHRRPRRILDLGTGSGVLALAAISLLHRPVLATDIEPWSVRTAFDNARLNQVAPKLRAVLAQGWRNRTVRRAAPYDLVFANILARPLCAMARDLSRHLAPGGTAILAGLLDTQAAAVLAAHRRKGLRLERRFHEGAWTTLTLRR